VADWDGAADGRDTRRWGHGTAIAAVIAGSGATGARLGVAPGVWVLPIDVQENLRATRSALLESDPRMRMLPASDADRSSLEPLRSSTWARAAGVAYAVSEGARVVTCAWPDQRPSWLLHDALLFAEENCTLPVCALDESTTGGRAGGDRYPAAWRGSWLGTERGFGDVVDLWTGEMLRDHVQRPLSGLMQVGAVRAGARRAAPVGSESARPDLLAATQSEKGSRVRTAVSNPRNDSLPGADRRQARFDHGGIAAGIVAGAAALVTARRDDLTPEAVREALLQGATSTPAGPLLSIPEALQAATRMPRGVCGPERSRRLRAERNRDFFDRFKLKVDIDSPIVPASPDEGEEGP
jgi:subtilisin family serine protease